MPQVKFTADETEEIERSLARRAARENARRAEIKSQIITAIKDRLVGPFPGATAAMAARLVFDEIEANHIPYVGIIVGDE